MRISAVLCLALLVNLGSTAFSQETIAAKPGKNHTVISRDGAWCWYQDPRAVYIDGVHRRTYAQWVTRAGRLEIGWYDHDTGETASHVLKDHWDIDDHNVGTILVLPDKRLMVFYARHNKPGLFTRTSANPEDITRWRDEAVVTAMPFVTYSHPVYLSDEGRYYVFWRGKTWKPTFATSTDGVTWSEPRVLIQDEGRENRSIRPYTKIDSDGVSSIHIAFTDGHPRNEPQNSIYYLKYENETFFRADGSKAGDMQSLPVAHSESDVVYSGVETDVRAWIWDIAVDRAGRPVIAYTRLPEETDHRYHYARWNGSSWLDTEIAPGGGWFPQTLPDKTEREPHYSGGVALDHHDPSTVYLSRPVNGIFEIEKWTTPDNGVSWESTAVTRESSDLNVRPVVPRGFTGPGDHVLWMYGRYVHYTFYKTGIRMMMEK